MRQERDQWSVWIRRLAELGILAVVVGLAVAVGWSALRGTVSRWSVVLVLVVLAALERLAGRQSIIDRLIAARRQDRSTKDKSPSAFGSGQHRGGDRLVRRSRTR